MKTRAWKARSINMLHDKANKVSVKSKIENARPGLAVLIRKKGRRWRSLVCCDPFRKWIFKLVV